MNRNYHLFQAGMWRKYAMCWDRQPNPYGHSLEWMRQIFRIDRAECIRRARAHLNYLRGAAGEQETGKRYAGGASESKETRG